MSTIKGKIELCTSVTEYFKDFQGINNATIIQRYDQLESIINKNIIDEYRHFLAQPIDKDDKIFWYSIKKSEVPKTLSSFKHDTVNYNKYQQIKQNTVTHYKNVIDELKSKNLIDAASYIEKAIKFINDDFIFCYDNIVVLGIWGMQLKTNINEPLGIYVVKTDEILLNEINVVEPPLEEPLISKRYTIQFIAGEEGTLIGNGQLNKELNQIIELHEVPKVNPKEGYKFVGWENLNENFIVTKDVIFKAIYEPIIHKKLPWYTLLWNWLKDLFQERGCLKWLGILLLLVLLLLLLGWLFRGCKNHSAPIPYPISNKPWIDKDPNSGKGGIFNPGSPYEAVPTPPEFKDLLPPNQGFLPPTENPEIIRNPGEPAILANRLNILLENKNISITEFAKDFKAKYPNENIKIVYYDDVVKRVQIEIPTELRINIKNELPSKFAPKYTLFVFDESLFKTQYLPSDPDFNNQNRAWYLNTINAPKAWDITKGSPKLTIAIVDNGFALSHDEFKNKIVMPYNVWSHSNEIFPQRMDHGTHVAGTSLALMDNNKGLSGIAPSCAFMPIQVADKNGLMTTTSILDGILYALYQGADVINVSLGNDFSDLSNTNENYQRNLLSNSFKEEERLWNEVADIADKHNATIVVAAGNDNVLAGIDPLQRPKNIVIVSAINKSNESPSKSSFSNYGEKSTISAPGVDIYSTIGNNNYTSMDGTSMAAPMVSAGIALVKSINEELSSQQIICLLKETGIPTKGNIGPLMQLDKLLKKVKSRENISCDSNTQNLTPSTGNVQVLLSWNNYNDLDLICTDPEGNTISFQNKKVNSGGMLEIDMNVFGNSSKTPIENIYWPNMTAPNGTYNVYLSFYKKYEQSIDSTPYNIKVKYGNNQKEFSGSISSDNRIIHICSFVLGSPSSTSPNENKKNNLLQEKERLQRELDRINQEIINIENQKNSIK